MLDLNMPEMDGKSALSELKGNPATQNIPVIIFTTSSDLDDYSECLTKGANAFYSKPSNYDDYRNMAKEILEDLLQSD